MVGLVCKTCGGTQFYREIQTASGDLACVNCGSVMEENPIVSEVTFAENAAGAATVQGSYVSNDQSHANFGNGRGSLESREQTLQNGKRRIRNVALALRIPDHISDAAYQWFKLALTNNFVQGRRSQNVIAACLYISCRKANTHHMLIDFSSRLQVSVYAIGATFLKMVKALHITNIPLVDPSLYIQHFADKLEFGKSKLKVIEDAKKIAKRMTDDWINEGRRPAGVAGACLLLAARMNNFRRTHLEIVAVTHIGSQTIQQRLLEFKKTDSSSLSVNDFRKKQVFEKSLPPSFDKNRGDLKQIKTEIDQLDSMEDEMVNDPILGAMLEESEITEDEIQYHIKRILSRKKNDLTRKISAKTGCLDEEIILTPGEANFGFIEDHFSQTRATDSDITIMIEKNKPKNLSKCLPTTEEILNRIPDDLSDDELFQKNELEMMILTKEESEMKEMLWTGSNQEYLLEQEQKRLKMETDKIAGHSVQSRKRRKRNVDEKSKTEDDNKLGGLAGLMRANLSGNASASDNAKALLTSKTLSKKINYNAVNSLFND